MIKICKNICFTAAILFLNSACAQTQKELILYNFSQVDSIIFDGINNNAFPGAVMLIGLNGEIIYKNSYGKFTYDLSSPNVKINTIYDLASMTKVIATTTAAMISVDKGLFKLDDPVYIYIPEFSNGEKKKITIKNLLLHNSGLPSWKKYYGKNLTKDEIVTDIYNLQIVYPVGKSTLYSDLGMILLGKIIEKVSEKSLNKFCEDEIYNKLEMHDTFFNPPDSLKYRIAATENDTVWRMKQIQGEVHDENASMLGGVAGHAGLFSTVEDIAKLIKVLLNEGNFNENNFIKPETIKIFTRRNEGNTRALGWDLKSKSGSSAGNYFSENSFGHTGFTGTSVWIDPDRNFFVVFLTNRVYPTRENKELIKIRPKLHDAIIKSIE